MMDVFVVNMSGTQVSPNSFSVSFFAEDNPDRLIEWQREINVGWMLSSAGPTPVDENLKKKPQTLKNGEMMK